MSPSITLETPIIESKPFLLRDSHLPMMIDDANFLKQHDDDDFSTDSWDQISNEEINEIVEITKGILSPPASPSNISIKSETLSDDLNNELDSPPILVRMEGKSNDDSDNEKKLIMDETPETRAMKRERNRLAARRCRQKQKDRIDYLERDVKEIEGDNYKVENEIRQLQQQLKELRDTLMNHDCMMKHELSRQRYFPMKF